MTALPASDSSRSVRLLQILLLAVVVSSLNFALQGNSGFSLSDEGFLWYGAQRTLLGELPLRDFLAYDPGRYYWAAAFMGAVGDNGIMALRGSVVIFQAFGLFVGLATIAASSERENRVYLSLAALILVIWMFPRHKFFDFSLSLILLGALAMLVESHTRRRYFLFGLVVGGAAVFGRNHGVYGLVAGLLAIAWLNFRAGERAFLLSRVAAWSLGIAIGFMPIPVMALTLPGFGEAFLDSLIVLRDMGSTNISLPVPWPWLVEPSANPFGVVSRKLLIGLFFVSLPVFGLAATVFVFQRKYRGRKVSPQLAASAFVSIPYAQHAFSRADLSHLCQSIAPLLVGLLVLGAGRSAVAKWSLVLVLAAASFWVMHPYQPVWKCAVEGKCTPVEISGDQLWVSTGTQQDIALLRWLKAEYLEAGESFYVAPSWPGAYALLEQKSPVWENYPLFHRSESFEQAEIKRLEKARLGFAVVFEFPFDKNESRRFSKTHPHTYEYFSKNFQRIEKPTRRSYEIYRP